MHQIRQSGWKKSSWMRMIMTRISRPPITTLYLLSLHRITAHLWAMYMSRISWRTMFQCHLLLRSRHQPASKAECQSKAFKAECHGCVPWQGAFEGRVPTFQQQLAQIQMSSFFHPMTVRKGRVPGGGASADCRLLTDRVCAYVTFRGLLPTATTVQILPLNPRP